MVLLACLVLDNKPGGLIKRILGKLTGPKLNLGKESAFGVEYALVRMSLLPGQGVDWAAVSAVLPPRTRCLLVPEGLTPPERLFPTPSFRGLEEEMLLRTACALADYSGIPAHERVAGLYDPDAECVGLLPGLLRRYTSVRVLTARMQKYREAAERILEETGAVIMIGQDPTNFSDCALLLYPGLPVAPPLPPRCPVLSARHVPGCKGPVFRLPDVALPEGSIPSGISHGAFAGALYALYGVAVGSLTASRLMTSGGCVGLAEAARIMSTM